MNSYWLCLVFLSICCSFSNAMIWMPCSDTSRNCHYLSKNHGCNQTSIRLKCPLSCRLCYESLDSINGKSIDSALLRRRDELKNLMESRLMSGENVAPKKYPFYVSVAVASTTGTAVCGGALIIDPSGYEQTYAISTAHCIVLDNYSIASSRIVIIAGVTSENDYSKGVYYKVTNYQHHQGYDSKGVEWQVPDLVIMKLELAEGVIDNNYVAPIRITKQDKPTQNCWIIAMGMTPNGKTATNLQEVALTWYNEMSEFAWQTSPVTCPGDTGAPVLCYEYDDNGKSDYALHGVVVGGTHRQRCAPNLNSYVSFFTRIRKFDDLISKFTGCNHNKICSKRM